MRDRLCVGWLFYAFALFIAFPTSSKSEQVYLISEGYFFQSPDDGIHQDRTSVLSLQFDGANISGYLSRLRGYDTTPIKVTGSNPTDGLITLTFHGKVPTTHTFQKKIERDNITWTATTAQDGRDLRFFRHRTKAFSDAQLTLSYAECGPHYGAINLKFITNVSDSQITGKLAADKDLSALTVQAHELDDEGELVAGEDGKYREIELPLLQALLKRIDALSIPNGSELYTVRALRETGLFEYVDMDIGGCAGADRSYFNVERIRLFDNDGFSEQRFRTLILGGLERFLSRGKLAFSLGKPRETKLRVPPYSIAMELQVRAASEVTRGVHGSWDQFNVLFEPFANAEVDASLYSVVVTVERMKTVRRSTGSSSPPDESYFKRDGETHEEAIITTTVSNALSDGYCRYEHMGLLVSINSPVVRASVQRRLKC